MDLLDVLFPKICIGCKKFGDYLCFSCFSLLSFNTRVACLICTKSSIDGLTHHDCKGKYTIDGYFAAVRYKSIARKLLYQFKYKPYLTDLQTTICDLLHESLIQQELFMKLAAAYPILIPIPLTAHRLQKRGYNQSEILANNLGKRFGFTVVNLLKRSKETKPQYGLKREERMENMRGAFGIADSKWFMYHGTKRTALLVDDVVTTGSTLKEAANVLKRNGFEKVYGVVFAQD